MCPSCYRRHNIPDKHAEVVAAEKYTYATLIAKNKDIQLLIKEEKPKPGMIFDIVSVSQWSSTPPEKYLTEKGLQFTNKMSQVIYRYDYSKKFDAYDERRKAALKNDYRISVFKEALESTGLTSVFTQHPIPNSLSLYNLQLCLMNTGETKHTVTLDESACPNIFSDTAKKAEFERTFKSSLVKELNLAEEEVKVSDIRQGSIEVDLILAKKYKDSRERLAKSINEKNQTLLENEATEKSKDKQGVTKRAVESFFGKEALEYREPLRTSTERLFGDKVKEVKEHPLFKYIAFDVECFDSELDCDYTSSAENDESACGGELYTIPAGWKGFGLKAGRDGKKEDNSWLFETEKEKGGWPLAFLGWRHCSPEVKEAKSVSDEKDVGSIEAHQVPKLSIAGKAGYGLGIYCTTKLSHINKLVYSEAEILANKKIHYALQCKVRPGSMKKYQRGKVWVIPNPADIRPYRLLYRKD